MNEYKEISIVELIICLLEKLWLILLATAVFGVSAYFITEHAITPLYKSTISMYVNNRTEASKSLTTTTSDVAAAKSLVNTYITIIESNSVLGEVVSKIDNRYTPDKVRKMMSANALNNTEVFQVSITSPSPDDSAMIANLIADLSPDKIADIVDGSSVKIIDRAVPDYNPVSPNVLNNIAIGAFLGFVISCLIILVFHFFDTTVTSEDDVKEITKLPVLGILSDFSQANNEKYGYSYGRRRVQKWVS